MVASLLPYEVGRLRNHLFIQVPWEKAETLRSRFQDRGILVTACYDPAERTAGLEVHRDVDPEVLRTILTAPQG